MATRRSIEFRVGIFLLVCAAVGVGLVWKFGKLAPARKNRYEIVVMFDNVGGLIPNANVTCAGISIGNVRDIKLVEDAKSRARVVLAIYSGFTLRRDAKFVINQSGLLGDRYVDVFPQTSTAEVIRPGEVVEGSASVDLTEAIRSVVDVLRAAGSTIERVDQAIRRIDETVLSPVSLGHVSNAFANVDQVTRDAVIASGGLRGLVEENRSRVDNALTKFSDAARSFDSAAQRADQLVARVDGMVATNQGDVAAVVKNLAESAARLNSLLEGVEKGEGTLGRLMKDPTLHDEIVRLVQNWRRHGLLYKEGIAADSKPKSVPIKPARPAAKTE